MSRESTGQPSGTAALHLAVVACVLTAVACRPDKVPSAATQGVRTNVTSTGFFPQPRSDCYVYFPPPALSPTGWQSWGDPTNTNACGVDITLNAIPDAGPDNRFVWFYLGDNDFDYQYDQNFIASGATDATGNTEDTPVILDFQQPVGHVRIDWNCSGVPGNHVIGYSGPTDSLRVDMPVGICQYDSTGTLI
ncbi:MAG: hypothetical protein ACREOG_08075 [Gemmatimonadaceae bacterium]